MEPAKKKSVIAAIKLLAQQMGRKSAAPAPVLADAVVDAQGSHASVETTTKPLHSPFVPTPEYVIGAFLSRLSPTDSVLDIGFGDGRVVVAAALCGHAAIGVENSPQLVSRAQLVASRCQIPCTSLAAYCAAHPTDAAQSLAGASASAVALASPRRTERALAAAHRTVSSIKQVNAERKALAAATEASAAAATAEASTVQSASPAIIDSTGHESNQNEPTGTAALVLEQLDVADAALTRDILPRVNAVFLYMLPEVNAFLWPLFVEHLPLGACVYTYTFSLLPEVQPKCDDRDSDASTQLEHDPSATKTPSAFQWAPEQVVDGKSSFDRLRLYRVTSDVRASYRAWVAASAKATKGTEAAQ